MFTISQTVKAVVDPFGSDELATPQPATIIAVYEGDDYGVRLEDGREFTVAGVDIEEAS